MGPLERDRQDRVVMAPGTQSCKGVGEGLMLKYYFRGEQGVGVSPYVLTCFKVGCPWSVRSGQDSKKAGWRKGLL